MFDSFLKLHMVMRTQTLIGQLEDLLLVRDVAALQSKGIGHLALRAVEGWIFGGQ